MKASTSLPTSSVVTTGMTPRRFCSVLASTKSLHPVQRKWKTMRAKQLASHLSERYLSRLPNAHRLKLPKIENWGHFLPLIPKQFKKWPLPSPTKHHHSQQWIQHDPLHRLIQKTWINHHSRSFRDSRSKHPYQERLHTKGSSEKFLPPVSIEE